MFLCEINTHNRLLVRIYRLIDFDTILGIRCIVYHPKSILKKPNKWPPYPSFRSQHTIALPCVRPGLNFSWILNTSILYGSEHSLQIYILLGEWLKHQRWRIIAGVGSIWELFMVKVVGVYIEWNNTHNGLTQDYIICRKLAIGIMQTCTTPLL